MKKKISNRKSNLHTKSFNQQLSLLGGAKTKYLELEPKSESLDDHADSDHVARVLARVYAMILSWTPPGGESKNQTKESVEEK